MTSRKISFGQSEITYKVSGNGDPVILVHGFGESGTVWKNQVAHLERNYTVIVPDLPGSGASDPIDDMSIEGLAEVVKAVWDDYQPSMSGPALPVLAGHSMGGYITLAYVEKYGDGLKKFGLVHSACFADTDEKKETRKKGIAFIRQHGASEFLRTTSPNLFSPHTKESNPQLVDQFLATLKNFPDQVLITYYEAMMARPDRSNVLKASKLPVMFVLGEHDTAIPIKDGLRQTSFPELSYISVLQHSGHMGMIEEPDELNRILSTFLQDT